MTAPARNWPVRNMHTDFGTGGRGAAPESTSGSIGCESAWSRRRDEPVANSVPDTQPTLFESRISIPTISMCWRDSAQFESQPPSPSRRILSGECGYVTLCAPRPQQPRSTENDRTHSACGAPTASLRQQPGDRQSHLPARQTGTDGGDDFVRAQSCTDSDRHELGESTARRAAIRPPIAGCGCVRSTPSWSGSRTSTSHGDPHRLRPEACGPPVLLPRVPSPAGAAARRTRHP